MIESMRLAYVSTHQTASLWPTVTHHEDGILLGCQTGLKMFNRKTKEIKLLKKGFFNVAQNNGDIFIAQTRSYSVSVMKYSETTTDQLFSFTSRSCNASPLSVSESYVAIIDLCDMQIKLYNRHTRHVSNIALPNTIFIQNLCFTSDGSLLVTSLTEEHNSDIDNDSEDDSDDDNSDVGYDRCCLLTKYRVEPESASGGAALTQLWSVKEDRLVCGVAESENGLIFLCGIENKTVYIYSGEGAYI